MSSSLEKESPLQPGHPSLVPSLPHRTLVQLGSPPALGSSHATLPLPIPPPKGKLAKEPYQSQPDGRGTQAGLGLHQPEVRSEQGNAEPAWLQRNKGSSWKLIPRHIEIDGGCSAASGDESP